MGRPFAEEVAELETTHEAARGVAVDRLKQAARLLVRQPMISVGSGGSLTTAAFASLVFQDACCHLSCISTPLDLAYRSKALSGWGVFLASAGGSNPDAVGAVRVAAQAEAKLVSVLCNRPGSKVAGEAAKFSNVDVIELETSAGSDGFLAVNSLWASCVALERAFSSVEEKPRDVSLGLGLAELVGAEGWQAFVGQLAERSRPLWEAETTIILYGRCSHPAAIDLESKLTEAALTNAWISDYRHFAHGRHHWLAKRGGRTSVVAFVSPSDEALAARTLKELPSSTSILRLDLPKTQNAALVALAHVFPLVLAAGRARGIDPGQPGVPAFGRRIYRLNAFGSLRPTDLAATDAISVAIRRKARKAPRLQGGDCLNRWNQALRTYVQNLERQRFRAVVFDYDGTLCTSRERWTGMSDQIVSELARLLHHGVRLGIATGRGRSVWKALRQGLPSELWESVLIGYYNGGQVASLAEGKPDRSDQPAEAFGPVIKRLALSGRLAQIARVEARTTQITITAEEGLDASECWRLVRQILETAPRANELKLLRSSHSFDLVLRSVSKLDVVKRVAPGGNPVLTVGDMGEWPGNDCELLSHPFSLSVDEVSVDERCCWNLAPPGVSGVDAALGYLRRMRTVKQGHFALRFPRELSVNR